MVKNPFLHNFVYDYVLNIVFYPFCVLIETFYFSSLCVVVLRNHRALEERIDGSGSASCSMILMKYSLGLLIFEV